MRLPDVDIPDPQTHADDHPDLPPEVLAIRRHADQVGDLSTWDW